MAWRNNKGEREKKKREKEWTGDAEERRELYLSGMALEDLISSRLEGDKGGSHVATWEKDTRVKPGGQRM